ncbi:hypothetical protein BH18ACT4_BH18ACT4_06800 [soil metagenome]
MPDANTDANTDDMTDDITKALTDAAYIAVGLGVRAFQKVQVQRQELKKQFGPRAEEARSQLGSWARLVEDQLKVVEARLRTVRPPG